MPDQIRPEDILSICNVLLIEHRTNAQAAFDYAATPEDRERAFWATKTIRDCIDKICQAHLNETAYKKASEFLKRTLGANHENACSFKDITKEVGLS